MLWTSNKWTEAQELLIFKGILICKIKTHKCPVISVKAICFCNHFYLGPWRLILKYHRRKWKTDFLNVKALKSKAINILSWIFAVVVAHMFNFSSYCNFGSVHNNVLESNKYFRLQLFKIHLLLTHSTWRRHLNAVKTKGYFPLENGRCSVARNFNLNNLEK